MLNRPAGALSIVIKSAVLFGRIFTNAAQGFVALQAGGRYWPEEIWDHDRGTGLQVDGAPVEVINELLDSLHLLLLIDWDLATEEVFDGGKE
jgi:hypothetical protein